MTAMCDLHFKNLKLFLIFLSKNLYELVPEAYFFFSSGPVKYNHECIPFLPFEH